VDPDGIPDTELRRILAKLRILDLLDDFVHCVFPPDSWMFLMRPITATEDHPSLHTTISLSRDGPRGKQILRFPSS
jgi:hypothetical protein